MRHSAMLVGTVIATLSTSAFAATPITLLGPVSCERSRGEPNTCTYEFPGFPGTGRLQVVNGGDDKKSRSSSAMIGVNGQEIFDKSDFDKNVSHLSSALDLTDNNTLTVQLAGQPNSYLTLTVEQDVQAEGGGVVDAQGGTVSVSDLQSSLHGVEILFPAGSVESPTVVTIREAATPPVSLPGGIVQDGPFLDLEASSELKAPVFITVPYAPPTSDDELRVFAHFDEGRANWNIVPPIPGDDPNKFQASLPHFSTYVKGKISIGAFPPSIYTGFDIGSDALRALNDGRAGCAAGGSNPRSNGICTGMSLLAERYFKRHASANGEGLKCWWSDATSWNVACEVHALYNPGSDHEDWVLAMLDTAFGGVLVTGVIGHNFFVDYLRAELLFNRPVAISLLGFDVWPPRGHSVLVTGWEKTGLFSGNFQIYDNQDNLNLRTMTYHRTDMGLLVIDYDDKNGHDYDKAWDSTSGPLTLAGGSIDEIISGTPPEFPCPTGPEVLVSPSDLAVDLDAYSVSPHGLSSDFGESYRVTISGAPDAFQASAPIPRPISPGDRITLTVAHTDLGNFSGNLFWLGDFAPPGEALIYSNETSRSSEPAETRYKVTWTSPTHFPAGTPFRWYSSIWPGTATYWFMGATLTPAGELDWGESACEISNGYWAPDGLGGFGCWFRGPSFGSCDDACTVRGLNCVDTNWNDVECDACKYFMEGHRHIGVPDCRQGTLPWGPYWHDTYAHNDDGCITRASSVPQSCGEKTTSTIFSNHRFCVCAP